MIKKYSTAVLYVLIVIAICSCAADYKKGPAGGIDDRIAPQVSFTFPANGSLNQDRDLQAEIEFGEFIKFSSTKKALSISPLTAAANSTIVWGEKSVDITFQDLEDNTTVLVIVNTSLQDMRGNGLADNFILTFSTGSVIDSTEFSGSAGYAIKDNALVKVDQKNTKVLLYKYQDVIDSGLFLSQPVYRAGVNREYDFALPHLKRDRYLPLVFQDGNNNDKLDVDAGELFSFGRGVVDFYQTDNYSDHFICSAADTIPPIIKEISEENIDLLKIEFSEPLAVASAIIDSVIMNKKDIFKYECRKEGEQNYLYAAVDSLEENRELVLYTSVFMDKFDNAVNPRMRKRMMVTGADIARDSLKLSGRIPTRLAVDDTLMFSFNKVSPPLALKFIGDGKEGLQFSLDEVVQKGIFTYKIPLADSGLKAGKYKFLISVESDTLYYNNFSIEKERGFGYISGSVSPAAAASKGVVLFAGIDNRGKPVSSRRVELSGNKEFKAKLRPGRYLVGAYQDNDQNSRYDAGDISLTGAFFAEKALVLQDTVLVRKNWESSGIKIDFND